MSYPVVSASSDRKHFVYTNPRGAERWATNPFYSRVDGRLEYRNGHPHEIKGFEWDRGALQKQISIGRPTSWYGSQPWPPESVWDSVYVGHKNNRRCLVCNNKSAPCHCHPETWLASLGRWKDKFYLHDDGRGKGIGVFAHNRIRAGEYLGLYGGKITFGSTSENQGSYDLMVWTGDWDIDDLAQGGQDDDTRVDAERCGTWTRFVNHSCEYNCDYARARVGRHELPIVQAIRDIRPNEEVTCDYGDGYFDEQNECCCGSDQCIKWTRGRDRHWTSAPAQYYTR